MEKKTFLNTWKDIPAANEIQHTIEGVECTSDGISTKMTQNNVSMAIKTDFDRLLAVVLRCLTNQNCSRLVTLSGIHGSKTNAWGSGHDLPEPKADQRYLGTGGDQAQPWQPLHHPLLQIQGHGNCSGGLFRLRRYPSQLRVKNSPAFLSCYHHKLGFLTLNTNNRKVLHQICL